MSQKQNIRHIIKERRQSLSRETITHKSRLALEQFMPILQHHNPHAVAVYSPIQNEFDIKPIIDHCKMQGIKILYPRVSKKNAPLTFHQTDDFETGAFGILQPPQDALQFTPDMIICPFIAVDRNKKRLGFGGGFYDRTIAALPNAITVATGYDFQYVEDFGAEDHDMVFDHVILV